MQNLQKSILSYHCLLYSRLLLCFGGTYDVTRSALCSQVIKSTLCTVRMLCTLVLYPMRTAIRWLENVRCLKFPALNDGITECLQQNINYNFEFLLSLPTILFLISGSLCIILISSSQLMYNKCSKKHLFSVVTVMVL